ncbi:hypothetical protein GP475_04960 [Corynebacterium poyangense]|uniref:Uncharacterized protein n=1 Tax=Corynebacterium poyangense TaxID=2684405 RepID=A0A7H0SNE0_9CORY|nr:hypothetical protein [Corynebacterium poyangense]MBZ8177093.1 hypothetical protein [Corynebacterium poyangense]QNQ90065.1 hypothetical protein GP475_04960 [Corynebacterium poyangense]
MDFLLQIQEIVGGPIKDLLVHLTTAAPQINVATPPPVNVTAPEHLDLGSTFGDINAGSTFGNILEGTGSTTGNILEGTGSTTGDILGGAGSSNFLNQAGSSGLTLPGLGGK